MKTKWVRIAMFLVLAAGIALAISYRGDIDADALKAWVKGLGAAGPVIYIFVYAVGTVLFAPGLILTVTGGALFGPVLGTFINLTGATLGALGSFLIARYLAHDWVEARTKGRMKTLMDGVETEGWRFVAFVRLVPLFPFNLLNYALGLTPIKLIHYVVASYIFMLPGAIAYTYIGYVGLEALEGGADLIQKGLLGVGLLALVAFLPRLIGQLRKKPMISVIELKAMMDAGDDIHIVDVRTIEDFGGKLGHIKEAINIPLEEVADRLSELDDNLEKTITLVCTTDRRSATVASILTRHGFADVHIVKGGMTDWNAQAYPTVT